MDDWHPPPPPRNSLGPDVVNKSRCALFISQCDLLPPIVPASASAHVIPFRPSRHCRWRRLARRPVTVQRPGTALFEGGIARCHRRRQRKRGRDGKSFPAGHFVASDRRAARRRDCQYRKREICRVRELKIARKKCRCRGLGGGARVVHPYTLFVHTLVSLVSLMYYDE